MSKDFLLTEKEINDTLLHSPYIMPTSPYERGQGGEQIKRYFYEFIRYFANVLNAHLSKIESESDRLSTVLEGKEELISMHNISENAHNELFDNIIEQIVSVSNEISLHNQDESAHSKIVNAIEDMINEHSVSSEAHSDIRSGVNDSINTHNTDITAHSDIREGIKSMEEKVNSTYNLASGKSKVMPLESSEKFFEYLEAGNVPNIGDMFIFESKNEPDITYYGKVDSSDGLIVLDYDAYKNGFIDIKPGNVYYHEGHKFIASESGIDTTVFAKTQELSELSYMLGNGLNDLSTRVSDLEASSLNHEKKKTYTTSTTTGIITLKTYGVTDLGEVSSLTLKLPSSVLKDYNSVLNFKSGASATVLDAPADIYFKGDSCIDGVFTPEANKLYEVYIKRPSSTVVAHVSAIDYVAG